MKKVLPLILLILVMLSCSPQPITGLYQTDTAGKVLMAGYDYQFFENSTFAVSYWSDNLGSNKKGVGTYRTRGNQLILQYEDFPVPEATYEWFPLEEMDDGNTYYQLTVQDQKNQDLGGLMIQLLDKNDQPLAQGITGMDGTYRVTIKKAQPAQTISLSYLGMKPMTIVLTDRMSSGYNIKMVPELNYIPAGTIEQFRYKSTATYLQLDDGVRQWRVVREKSKE